MAFVSCSTTSVDVCEEEIAEKKVSVEEEYVKLNNDILELNSNLQKQNTRGFLSRFFKRILNVFVSDVVGAVQASLREMIYGNLLKAHQLVLLKTRGL